MQISKRLRAVAGMVTSGSILADIGTDHAYIPIYLVSNKTIPRALAMDVNRGPLEKAQRHIQEAGLEALIETRLSDGLAALHCKEAESIIIAGMGGPLMVRILKEGRDRLTGCRELILQPQSDIRAVRAYIEEAGWQIVNEEMICEEQKFYPMMRAVPREQAGVLAAPLTEKELRFGPFLIKERHPVLKEFLLSEGRTGRQIQEALAGQQGEGAVRRRQEVEEELRMIGEILELYKEPENICL